MSSKAENAVKNTSTSKCILGISAYYHDSAAAIIVDGIIVAASQEERYTRLKHDPRFPANAIAYCLSQANLTLEQVDSVVFYDKPLLKFERLLETYLANAPRGYRSFVRAMPIWLKEKLYLKQVLKTELANVVYQDYAQTHEIELSEAKSKLKKTLSLPQLLFTEHHQSHAAAAYYPSPCNEATVVCLDGVGEWATSSIWSAKSGEIKLLQEINFPHSLGLLYSAFTQYCGFKVNSGEYKLMGLAPYGEPRYVELILDKLVSVKNDGSFSLDMQYFDFAKGKTMTNAAFHKLFDGPPHPFDQAVTQKQMDLAKSIQVVTEQIVLKVVETAFKLNPSDNLCLAGGVALNCVANGRVQREGPFNNVWIQPAAGDAGSALGAALQVWHQFYENDKADDNTNDATVDNVSRLTKNDLMQGTYLGDAFATKEVKAACEEKKLLYTQLTFDDLYKQVAVLLTQDKVIGWFQDAMEFGPRALGNRSIIGDPRSQNMQTQMNLKIKQRESFRPFAPVVLEEDAQTWFDLDCASPYMLLTAQLKSDKRHKVEKAVGLQQLAQVRSVVPAITHVDNSARVQTLNNNVNPKLHQLITEFKHLSGVGMLINTSFNVRGEPPVRTPQDAIRTFLATDMDILVMQDCILCKHEQPQSAIVEAKRVSFEKD
jgi:carbamoyltransferase